MIVGDEEIELRMLTRQRAGFRERACGENSITLHLEEHTSCIPDCRIVVDQEDLGSGGLACRLHRCGGISRRGG